MSSNRPKLRALLERMQAGDTLVVWKLDRLGRSTLGVLQIAEDLTKRGIALEILTLGVNTMTPMGRLMLTILTGVAEMELALIRERVVAGIKAKRARGHFGGNETVMTPSQVVEARRMRGSLSITVDRIAADFGVTRETLYNYWRRTRHMSDRQILACKPRTPVLSEDPEERVYQGRAWWLSESEA